MRFSPTWFSRRLRAIRAKGVDVYIQIAPGDHKLDFEK